MNRIGIVGAGNIAHVHAEAIRENPCLTLHAVIDPDERAANAFAKRWGNLQIYTSAQAAIIAGGLDRVHICTPPNVHHASAKPFLKAGISAFIEKPMAVDVSECNDLIELTRTTGATLGVNQNFLYHPAYIRLRRAITDGHLGRIRHVNCVFNVPLRQFTARQFGQWMFAEPCNILLEQAVHPLSQIVALTGAVAESVAIAGKPMDISPGVPFHTSVGLQLRCRNASASLQFAVGQSFPFWQITAVCDDGVAVADILSNRFFAYSRTRWMDIADTSLIGARVASAILFDTARFAAHYLLSLTRLKGRSDPFYLSMKGSIAAFHDALDEHRSPECDAAFGAHLVSVCRACASSTFAPKTAAEKPPAVKPYDIAVLGGTGFIGRHVVKRLRAEGLCIGVMARNIRNLPSELYDDNVVLVRGDVHDPHDVERAVGPARIVINLAHGGGGTDWDEIRARLVGSAGIVARACLAKNVEKLVHVGSIASLYLGSTDCPITGATPPDTRPHKRSSYARAKAECDIMLMDMHRREGLPVCILRPGVVLGEGGVSFHSGVGMFNNEQHCIGWNAGTNPLPLVLVEDVAEAVWQACRRSATAGRCYNVVGDVRLTADEYLAELRMALRRPLRFHPSNVLVLWLIEISKWTIKTLTGRKSPVPTLRDIRSRGLAAQFDCEDIRNDLGWTPVSNRGVFIDRAIAAKAEP